MQFMVIETFRPGRVADIYRRLKERGRQMPAGLIYVDSWISDDLAKCWQVMECDDPALLIEWASNWADLMEFEIVPVIASDEARRRALRP